MLLATLLNDGESQVLSGVVPDLIGSKRLIQHYIMQQSVCSQV